MSSFRSLANILGFTPFGANLARRPDLPWSRVPSDLPIAAGIGHGMGGRVSWSSVAPGQPGAGAVFRLIVPSAEAAATGCAA